MRDILSRQTGQHSFTLIDYAGDKRVYQCVFCFREKHLHSINVFQMIKCLFCCVSDFLFKTQIYNDKPIHQN